MRKVLFSAIAAIVVLYMLTAYYEDNAFCAAAFQKDMATKEAEYLKRVEKDRIREEYGRKIMDKKPSGFMSVEEYEKLSQPVDKFEIDYGVPQIEKPYDTQYVPHPIYKLARYNDPPGTPDLSISQEIYQTGQLNLPGVASPNLYFMVYPAVYYYRETGAITSDLFIVPLKQDESAVTRILKANIANRFPEPILSTEKELTNTSLFRSLTPIDFSADSSKLLVKEKIGSSADGIWETNIIVYNFLTQSSHNLVELREAIVYYWHQYKGLNLTDKRWDIYPLGFSKGNPDRILATAYAYTGDEPVFLGVWSIDTNGSQARLISMTNGSIEVASNGFKLVKDGVVPKTLAEQQEKNERDYVKRQAKEAEKELKKDIKAERIEMKEKLKEVDKQFKREREDYRLMDKLKGSTEQNENVERYEKLQAELDAKRKIEDEKAEQKKQLKEQKEKEKEQKKIQKEQEWQAKQAAKYAKDANTPPSKGQPLSTPAVP